MPHDGKRLNFGRKTSVSTLGQRISAIRVPTTVKADVLLYHNAFKKDKAKSPESPLKFMPAALAPFRLARPIYSGKVSAGQSRFPSPAQDYEQKFLDLNERYISNPPATFFFEVKGNSMEGAGIFEGDTVIVDRALKPKSSSIVIASVDGEWMVKRLYKRGDTVKLLSEHPDHPPIAFSEGQELTIFGVVTYVIHQPK